MAATANVQILQDTDHKVVVRMLYFTDDGTNEAQTLKVNTATLKGRVWSLTVNTAALDTRSQRVFIPGEFCNTNNSNTGYVLDYVRAAGGATGTLRLVGSNGASTFAASANIQSQVSGLDVSIDAATVPQPLLAIESIAYSIGSVGIVRLLWGGTTNSSAIVLAGPNGYYGKNELAALIPNDNAAPNDNFVATTAGLTGNTGYNIVMTLKKVRGFAGRPGY
jgi:hypothetical protein